MATTAAKLRAVVTADVGDAIRQLRLFGNETEATKNKAARETSEIARLFKDLLAGFGLFAGINALAGAVGGILSGLWNSARQIAGEAYAAVRDYEMLYAGLRQLTASQIVGAGVTDDMATALKMAEEPSKNLINWIEQLAVKSPFTSAEVAQAFRMAEAFGFNESQAKRLTAAMTDFSAGAGLSGEYIQRIMLNMGQMAAAGKVTSREIKDLAMAGLPVKNILAEAFGVTTQQMNKMLEDGAVPVGKAFEAITTYLETRFQGAAARTTETWQGLQSSLQDIKQIDLRELFGGVFEAIRPEAARLVSFLSSSEFRGKLREVGTALGEAVKSGIAVGKEALGQLLSGTGLNDIVQQIKNGDFKGAVIDLIGKIEFGVMTAAVEIRAVGEKLLVVGTFIFEALKSFITNLGAILTTFSNVLTTRFDAFSMRLQAVMRGGLNMGYNREAGQRETEADLALSNFRDLTGMVGGEVVSAYDRMGERIDQINGRRSVEIGIVEQARLKYYQLAEAQRVANATSGRDGKTTNAGRGIRQGGRFDPRTGAYTPDPLDAVVGNGTFNNFPTVAEDAGAAAGKKMADAMEKAIDRMLDSVKGKLQRGMQVSVSLGKLPGLDPMEAGANGPFENLYRLQDVATHLGQQGQSADTVRFYKQFFDGQSFEQAAAQARAIVTQFQQGSFTDDVLKYVDLDKLRQMQVDEAGAEASQDRLAKLVGADPKYLKRILGTDKDVVGAGAVLSDKDAEALAASLKTGVLTGLDKVAAEQPTVMQKLLGGVATTGKDGSAAVNFGGTLVPAMVAAIDAELVANGSKLSDKGAAAWDLVEKGFVERAGKSAAFVGAVNAMVDSALKNYIPKNQ